jgi:DivIVA domain-containing protein
MMAEARGIDLLTEDESVVEAAFDVTLRGYDRHQVDAYVARTDRELHEVAERVGAAEHRVRQLTAELEAVRAELARTQRFVRGNDGTPSYAALGRRVEEILALAEQQADDIRARARETAVAAVSLSPPR